MLRSNSKIVRMAVREWIMNSFDPDGYDEYQSVDQKDWHQVAVAIVSCCEQEKRYSRPMSMYEKLDDWFRGLPSILDTAEYLYCGSAVELVGNWFQETEDERSRFDESKAQDLANHLIARELIKEVEQ